MSATTETFPNIDVLLDVGVKVSVELGSCQLPMRDVLQLAPGSVVQLDQAADAPVDLYVNGKKFARGEIIVIEGRVGIKVTEVTGAKG
jgi:flagellar motor switch protein FliN/FliY